MKESIWEARAEIVRSAIRRSWHAYRTYATGADDLAPVSRTGRSWLHAQATLYDSLDTLWLAGLHDQFDQAVQTIAAGVQSGSAIFPSHVFEFHIRVVGGLLGGFSVSGDRRLLTAAKKAADLVLEAFESASGMPYRSYRMVSRADHPLQWGLARILDRFRAAQDPFMQCNSLAGAGSFGLELRVLSRETGLTLTQTRTLTVTLTRPIT